MAELTRGKPDQTTRALKNALDAYEQGHADAKASLYRQNSGSVRIRVLDPAFARMSIPARHRSVWRYLSGRVDSDAMQQVSLLLLLDPDEMGSSFMNVEFEDPTPSRL